MKSMPFILTSFTALIVTTQLLAQVTPLITPPNGGNKKAIIGERIGITDVVIHYDRPGVKGREGKIYGTPIVHTGFQNLTGIYGSSKAAPWRAGANENTTMEFSTHVKIEGKYLPAGKYGFFIAYDPSDCIIIFSKKSNAWGSFFYDEKEDALRVHVKPVALTSSVEWLRYDFIDETDNSATVALSWEKVMIPFKVEVDLIQTQLESFREELKGDRGFRWESWLQAATLCLDSNVNLEEGLLWADSASGNSFVGKKNFQTLSTRSLLLDKLGKKEEAASVMKEAIPFASMIDLHVYGRKLLAEKRLKEAFEIFKLNAQKNPNQFIPLAGLTRAYSALGDYKNALENARAALPLAPNQQNKTLIEVMIKKLQEGKDVN
jgi:hypothetical protein